MKRLVVRIMMVLSVLLYFGCAASPVGPERTGAYSISDISGGLPTEGLWRQSIALVDMDGDGFLDIAAPPPRKAEAGQNRPFIFIRGKDGKWKEGNYSFPEGKNYGYGGIGAGDINGDGYPDIVLAVHSGKIILLQNNKGGGFVETAFPVEKRFHSRTVEFVDINGDGQLDIVALSESKFTSDYTSQGLLIGINKDGKDWDVRAVEDSIGWHGDSFAIGDINGDGKKDIAVATLAIKEGKKIIWFGDGKGNFKSYEKDIAGHTMPMIVRAGDIDGDVRDEVVFIFSTLGKDAVRKLSVLKWAEDGFNEISSGLGKEEPFALDLADLDGDGKMELVVLSEKAIRIYKYLDAEWVERGQYPVSPEDVKGVRDLRGGRNKDGSFLIVYNLGGEDPALHRGIKAFLLKK